MTLKLTAALAALTMIPEVATAQAPAEPSVRIVMERSDAPAGRLLLLAQPSIAGAPAPRQVNVESSEIRKFAAAREVSGLTAGSAIRFDSDDVSFPGPLADLPAGDYWIQAVLDQNHDYAYMGRGGGDVVSEVAALTLPLTGPAPTLTLSQALPVLGPWQAPWGEIVQAADRADVEARIDEFAFQSPVLSDFNGRPTVMRGLVLTPFDYDQNQDRYPVVYFTHGFAAGMVSLKDTAQAVMRQIREGALPPMIWVFLDGSGPNGTHEFADSVNNGPWATALTQELIPDLDRQYRTDGVGSSRFLIGHSSGGWAVLWLQVNYPKMFAGAWPTAPDYSDFTAFGSLDLTEPGARRRGTAGARLEQVLGEYGGQMTSFESVFSPRGANGRPMPLFDRHTGLVDPMVAAHWRTHWDISQIIRNRWSEIGPDLDGKVHLFVGEEDDYNLDESARRLQTAFDAVGGRAEITIVPGKKHFDLYAENGERMALRRKIAWRMWGMARPNSPLTDPGPPPAPPAPPAPATPPAH